MKPVIIGSAMLLLAGTASASTMTAHFDLAAGGWALNQTSLSYSNNGIDLTVTGLVCDDGRGPNHSSCNNGTYENGHPYDPRIDRSGITGIYFSQPNDSDHQVDGDGSTNEFLKLTFDPIVTLSSLMFSYWDENDNARVFTHDSESWSSEKNIRNGSSFWHEHEFDTAYEGSSFLVGATGSNDEWKLKSVSVDYKMPDPVPLPAAGWLLVGAFAGLGAMRRRRSAA